MRKRIKVTGFSDWETMFYNNVLSIPVLAVLSIFVEDWSSDNVARSLSVNRNRFPHFCKTLIHFGHIAHLKLAPFYYSPSHFLARLPWAYHTRQRGVYEQPAVQHTGAYLLQYPKVPKLTVLRTLVWLGHSTNCPSPRRV